MPATLTDHARLPLEPAKIDAVIFDLDGVITDTRCAHQAAWKRLFNEYLKERGKSVRSGYTPFSDADYSEYLDGKPRYDGVRDFLASRDIRLPWGDPADLPGEQTVCGLGNRKNRYFNEWLANNRVHVFPDALCVLQSLNRAGFRTAIISASKNCEAVLANAQIRDLFGVKVDGQDMADLGLPGKPDPAIFLQAAERLGVQPERAAVVEDALAGVQAAADGGFALVIGVNRGEPAHGDALRNSGADIVTTTLSSLLPEQDQGTAGVPVDALPSFWSARDQISERLRDRHLALFLDYDGTLTPIVEDYRKARLNAATRAIVGELARSCAVAIISGRDLEDVRALVDLDQVFYAGSHGFDIAGPRGWREQLQQGVEFLPDLDAAETALTDDLGNINGARVERKKFSIAVHYRQVAEGDVPAVEQLVSRVLAGFPRLRASSGKKVFDLKPRTDWNKGQALLWLLERYQLNGSEVLPVYVGDDTTDEDAFHVLRQRQDSGEDGIAILVRDDSRRRSLANYTLENTDDVTDFLKWLAASITAGGTA
ncbi:trehalose-phosphatase [Kineobactrum salinum]|uniref:trehalose-phosphatase n=1 Tax=Kineobactrum salinum TaxID=2708301 RepID=UPI001E4B52E6|nr:trehalose-phosphatase [Kineobactrum salinum]